MDVSNSNAPTTLSRKKRGEGINWAVQNGADIISNSWGSSVQYQIIDDAITNAVTNGRNGKGAIVVFAAGNDNSTISYPANSNPAILTVGAMSPCGQRKSPSSCDGESKWGSNYGSQLDVVAPGVLIATTDRQGNNGYNPNFPIHLNSGGNKIYSDYADKNYTVWFNGTSAAAPFVSGVAALILSVNPNLSGQQVRNIIEQTAQKVGGYSYANTSGRTNGTWHNQMGYGLIDAYAAVTVALTSKYAISGPTTLCSQGVYTIDNLPSGATVTWSANPNFALSFTQGSSTTTATRIGNFDGTVEINATILNNSESLVISKSVRLGITPIDIVSFTNSADSYDHFCTSHVGNTYHIQPGNIPNTTYQYRLRQYPNLNVVYTSPPGRSHSDAVNYIPPQGWYEFQVRATNSCGTGPWIGYEVEYVDCSIGWHDDGEYRISPNPTSSILTIEKNKDRQVKTNHEYNKSVQPTYQLYDFYANMIISGNMSDITTINVSNYRKGIYILKINFKGISETHKIIVE